MTTKTTASTTAPAKAPTTTAKKPTQKPAQPAKAAGAAKAAQSPQKATQPTKASTTKPDAALTPVATVPVVRFYRLRKTGTTRHLPVLDAGSEDRKAAEAIAQRLANGETVQAIAEATGLSVSTVRRQAATLDFTQRVEAGEFTPLVKKAKDGRVIFPASTKDEK